MSRSVSNCTTEVVIQGLLAEVLFNLSTGALSPVRETNVYSVCQSPQTTAVEELFRLLNTDDDISTRGAISRLREEN